MFLSTRLENIKENFEQNYLATALHLRYFAEKLANFGGGQIIIIGSYQGVTVGLPGYSLESAGNHGLWALCESVRDELKENNVLLSYFVSFNYDLESAQNKNKGYLANQIDQIFPERLPSVQADILLDGISNQYFFIQAC